MFEVSNQICSWLDFPRTSNSRVRVLDSLVSAYLLLERAEDPRVGAAVSGPGHVGACTGRDDALGMTPLSLLRNISPTLREVSKCGYLRGVGDHVILISVMVKVMVRERV